MEELTNEQEDYLLEQGREDYYDKLDDIEPNEITDEERFKYGN
jgi:hypothetical protein